MSAKTVYRIRNLGSYKGARGLAGRLVHLVSAYGSMWTLCGRNLDGGHLTDAPLSCPRCTDKARANGGYTFEYERDLPGAGRP